MSADQYDLVVVGCGPVGASAANLLGARGLRTLVLERDVEPCTTPRAIHFDHEIMRIFQSAGMAAAIEPHTYSPEGAMFFGAHRRPIRRFQPNQRTDRLGWASANYFYQPELERVLRTELESRSCVTALFGCTVTDMDQRSDAVRLTFEGSDGSRDVEARYVIGCDGGRSTVRRLLDVELDDLGFEEPWIVADAFVDGPITLPELHDTPAGVDMQEVLFIVGDPARPTSVIPGIGRHRRWEFMLLPGEAPESYEDGGLTRALIEPYVPSGDFELIRTAVYRFHALIARRWRRDRVFLAGDSAHQTPPFFGQGMCHGIRDVANLAWKLEWVVRRGADPSLLDTYQSEREPQVRSIVEASVRAGRLLCTLDPEVAAARDERMSAEALSPAPAYVDLIPPITSGIITAGIEQAACTARGARFIQPPLTDAGGTKRLLDDWAPPGFLLVAWDPPSDPDRIVQPLPEIAGLTTLRVGPAGGGELQDVSGELRRWFDERSCSCVLVRPDGYVFGTATGPSGAARLVDELAQLLFERHSEPSRGPAGQ